MNDSIHAGKAGHLLLVIGLACLMFFSGLGSIGLTDRDEGRNAEAGREMLESGDGITPTFNYEPRFIKPAMLYWLMSASYWAFDATEFAARLPSALFGVGLITLQYLFLVQTRGAIVGLLGAVMLLLNIEVFSAGRQALTDMVLMFFTTLSAYAFWLGFNGTVVRRHWLVISYIAMACGTLDKGPPGFLVPLLAIVPYVTVTNQWNRFWREGLPLGGTAIFLAFTVPYYAAMLLLHGSSYSAEAQMHTVSRFLNPFYGWGGTVFFYVPVLLLGFFPWSPLLIAALYDRYRNWRRRRKAGVARQSVAVATEGRPDQDLELFALLWCAAVFLFFSLGATRLPHYIAPLYPAAAIVAALYWDRARPRSRARVSSSGARHDDRPWNDARADVCRAAIRLHRLRPSPDKRLPICRPISLWPRALCSRVGAADRHGRRGVCGVLECSTQPRRVDRRDNTGLGDADHVAPDAYSTEPLFSRSSATAGGNRRIAAEANRSVDCVRPQSAIRGVLCETENHRDTQERRGEYPIPCGTNRSHHDHFAGSVSR